MKVKSKIPSPGNVRHKHKFLFMPRTLRTSDGNYKVTRWLEFAVIEQKCFNRSDCWEDICWADL